MTGASGLDGYRRFLAARDGAADLRRATLAAREALFASLDAAPLRARTSIDREAYRRNLKRRRVERGLDARVLWLLASAKANQSERFGVGLAELYGRTGAADDDIIPVHLHLQERYHTRILADVVALFDLPVHVGPPPLPQRWLITLMVRMPVRWTLPVVGGSEMIGCIIFQALRDRGVALFADEPALADRIRLLYDEILADEISHVGCIAAQLGPTGRRLMRAVCWWVGMRLARQMPELLELFDAAELARRFRGFRLDVLASEHPDRAYVAAMV